MPTCRTLPPAAAPTCQQDVGLACFSTPEEAAAGAITGLRLANASADGSAGNLEAQLAGVLWTPVCGAQAGGVSAPGPGYSDGRPKVAAVVCRMLGFRSGLFLPSDAFGRSGGPFELAVQDCGGGEASLAQCQLSYGGGCMGYTASVACFNGSLPAAAASPTRERSPGLRCPAAACGQAQAGVAAPCPAHLSASGLAADSSLPDCHPLPPAGDFTAVRLVNGSSPASGVLQVQFQGAAWGTVCSDGGPSPWSGVDLAAAAVVCNQMGLPGGAALLPSAAPPELPVLLTGVSCANSSLASLDDCTVVLGGSQCGSGAVRVACLGGVGVGGGAAGSGGSG